MLQAVERRRRFKDESPALTERGFTRACSKLPNGISAMLTYHRLHESASRPDGSLP